MKLLVMTARALYEVPLSAQEEAGVPVTLPEGADGEERSLATLRMQEDGWRIRAREPFRFVALEEGLQPLEQQELPLACGRPLTMQGPQREVLRLLPREDGAGPFLRYALPEQGTVRLGGGGDCQICSPLFGCAGAALELRCGGTVTAVNLHAAPWNLYRNGRSINTAELQPGDWLLCAGVRVLLGPGFLALEQRGEGLRCTLPLFGEPSWCELPASPRHDVEFAPSPAAPLLEQAQEIRVQPPPAREPEPQQSSTLLTLLPGLMMSAAMLGSCLLALSGSGGSVVSAASGLIMVACMGISCTIPVFTRRSAARARRARQRAAEADYRAYLEALEQRIRRECEIERFNLLQRNPPPAGEKISLTAPSGAVVTVDSCAARSRMNGWKGLWERGPADADFLHAAVGVGDLPAACRIVKPDPPEIGEVPGLYREMEACLEKTPVLQNVPVTLDLRAHRLAGIVGKDRHTVCRTALALLVELTALHSCEDLRIVVIHGEQEREFWSFARWMPHIWRPDGEGRLLANDAGEIKALSQHLQQLIAQRRESAAPWYLILDADEALSSRADVLRRLCAEGAGGMTLVQLRTSTKQLARSCTAILDTDARSLELRQGGLAVTRPLHTLADFDGDAKALFCNMYHIRPAGTRAAGELPRELSFLDMFQVGSTAQLNIARRWRQSDPVHSLKAMIGRDRDGFPIWLDLHEKAHGPHGLVAGMTGSGKSEFLISYVLAMAASYRPDEVAFVLIDFKGGGMADVFRGLPHLAGAITNLDGTELRRSFLAIESELERRQQLFQQAARKLGVGSLDIYSYQAYCRQGKLDRPLPHLILISDEFAELKLQHGDFMDQLIRIARIGRSLGVHLILATQKPDGVVNDQILSNIRFKVCLKVQSRADSQSMLGVPDAAALSCAGRFYYQVGFNELFELGQSGWSGAPYREKERYEPPRDLAVELLNEQGAVVAAATPRAPGQDSGRRQAAVLLEAIGRAARAAGFAPRPLWQEPLPTVRRRTAAAAQGPAPCVGRYDDLYGRSHPPLTVPFAQRGSAVVYGASGSGKSAFVERLLMSCMETFAPDQLLFWLADAEAGSLQAFEGGSHTAWLALPGQFTAYREMLDRLLEELEERKRTLQPFGGERERYLAGGGKMPFLLAVVHDLNGFLSGEDGGLLLEKLRELGRAGHKYGIALLITATDARSVHYSLKPLLPQVFVLRLTGEEEYDELLGRTGGMRPSEGLGRGLVRVETPGRERGYAICEFQVDVPFADAENPYDALCAFVKEKSAGAAAPGTRQLPQRLDAAFFDDTPCQRRAICVAMTRKGGPVLWDFFREPLLQADLPEDLSFARGLARLLRRGCRQLLVLDGTGRLGPVEGCRVAAGEEMAGAVEQFWQDLCDAIQRDNAHYDAAGEDLAEPGLGLVVCDSEAVARGLSARQRQDLNEILRYRNEHVLLVRCVLSSYDEGVVCPLDAVNEAGRPARTGLALTPPRRYSQSLFDCGALGAASPFGGLVRDGGLVPCGFAQD